MRVLVIGGGIGGLAAAIALRQQGIEPLVFEQADDLSKVQVGAGLAIWHNAMRALTRLGVGDQVLAVAPVVTRFEGRTWKGEVLSNWPMKEMRERIGIPSVGISRPDLYAMFVDAVPSEYIRTSAACTGFEQDDDGVTARFADGTTERGDVLVGADGLHSTIRTQVLGPDEPRVAGYAVWRAQTQVGPELAVPGDFITIWGPGQRFVFYFVRQDLLYWLAVRNVDPDDKDDPARLRDDLLERYRGWAPPVQEIIAATPPEAIFRTDVRDRAPVDRWGEGRVTLLGDAAHAMTFNVGQGAGMALEDGLVLARCLHDESDAVQALRKYESERMERTAGMVNLAWRMGSLGRWKNPVAVAMRNQMMRRFNGKALASHERDMAVQI